LIRLKVKGQGHWERKCKKIVFREHLRQKFIDLHQTETKIDQQSILHISSTTCHQLKCFVFVIICNYPGRPHVAAATWPCTYLFGIQFEIFNKTIP